MFTFHICKNIHMEYNSQFTMYHTYGYATYLHTLKPNLWYDCTCMLYAHSHIYTYAFTCPQLTKSINKRSLHACCKGWKVVVRRVKLHGDRYDTLITNILEADWHVTTKIATLNKQTSMCTYINETINMTTILYQSLSELR